MRLPVFSVKGAVVRDLRPELGGDVEAIVLPHPYTGRPVTWFTVVSHAGDAAAMVFLDVDETSCAAAHLSACAAQINGSAEPSDERQALEQVADIVGAGLQDGLTPMQIARLIREAQNGGLT